MLSTDQDPKILLDHFLETTRHPVKKNVTECLMPITHGPRRVFLDAKLSTVMDSHDDGDLVTTGMQRIEHVMKAPSAAERPLIIEKILTIEHVGHGVASLALLVPGGKIQRQAPISIQTGNGMGTRQMQATMRNVQRTIHGVA